jgi:polysaccharide export outer membrane protein
MARPSGGYSTISSVTRYSFVTAVFAVGVLLSATASYAQDTGSTGAAPASAQAASPALLSTDATISRTQYHLGPGDRVNIAIFGDINELHTLAVTPDGAVVIPSVGVVGVMGLNLDEAQERVRQAVYRLYRNVDVTLTLSGLRTFRVFVVGDVPNPGVRAASPVMHVSEVVSQIADGGPIRRNIFVRRSSGEVLRVDLADFVLTGNLSANPTLQEGDVLMVPKTDETIRIFGEVAFPGTYEFRPGESLADLLFIANGGSGFPADAADTLRVTRFLDQQRREVFSFTRADALGDEGQRFILEPFDAVYVARLSDYKQQKTAQVRGEVVRPGTYPIEPGVTTVRDLVALAGGFTPDASLLDASLRREPVRYAGQQQSSVRDVPLEFFTIDERRVLQVESQGDETNVVIDFERLFLEGGSAYDQTLQSGDELIIPRRRNEVAVLGAVLQPGLVQYAPGQDIRYFISRAGGYTNRADRDDVVVIKARLDVQIDADDVSSLDPGDRIIVPFREPRTLLQQIAAANTVINTVSGFLLTIFAIDRLF